MLSILQFLRKGHWLLCPFLFLSLSCVNKEVPTEEYNLARIALQSAKDSEAKRYAPRLYTKARGFMRKAERAYEERYFKESADYFKRSRYYSEKAENKARVKMFSQGEMAQ